MQENIDGQGEDGLTFRITLVKRAMVGVRGGKVS